MVLAARSHLDQRLKLHVIPRENCPHGKGQAWLQSPARFDTISDGMAHTQGESGPVWTSSRNTIAMRKLREDPGTFSSFNFRQFLFTGAFQKQGRTSALCIPLSTTPILKSLGNMENNKQEIKICLCESMLVPPNKTYRPMFIPQL